MLCASTGLSVGALFYNERISRYVDGASIALHAIALLVTLRGAYRSLVRVTNFTMVTSAIFALVLVAFASQIAVGVVTVMRKDYSMVYKNAFWCGWAGVIIDFVNFFFIGIQLFRGLRRVDVLQETELS